MTQSQRRKLAIMEEQRKTFRGTFVRTGTKPAYKGDALPTLLLEHITEVDNDVEVTDHLWFNLTKGFQALMPLSPGDIVQFDARVKEYVKGYVNRRQLIDERRVDYKLSHPTKISRVEKI